MKVLQPLYDQILVEPIVEEETKQRILLPDSQKEKPQIGTVKRVGSGKIDGGNVIPLTVKIGDYVIFRKFAGTEVEFEGKKYHFMREAEVIAVIRDEEQG